MSVAGSQQRTFLDLLAQLRPHWRRDRNLPARIQNLLAHRRSFGSRDRRLYRELLYTTLRFLPWIEPHLGEATPEFAIQMVAWLAADSPATERFRRELLTHWPPAESELADKAIVLSRLVAAPRAGSPSAADATRGVTSGDLLPGWFREHCPEAFFIEQLDALSRRAPLWLRVQTDDRGAVAAEFAASGWAFAESSTLPSAWRLLNEVDVTKTRSYEQGALEIQDLGSQLVLALARISPGERWLDACAGAGGKTLQLSSILGSAGAVDAHDVRPAALDELAKRAMRAGIPVAREDRFSAPTQARFAPIRVIRSAAETYDGVLVDAPCTGSGTWRRAPHLKWTTTASDVEAAAKLQGELLAQFSRNVRAGGRLVYATCSLSRRENEDVVATFVEKHPEFSVELPSLDFGGLVRPQGVTILPAQHDTDGFFVSCLRRS